ncbi:4'-phosphopantetheinyl transferase family protein [Bradyrhizobium erythrophlei]|uniref:Enterobactin synthase component D n=1 Tax=Bradyrhizobium erythrophlei TaxID=1437360 RepID=A0A1M5W7Y9_9BRAD|nr:4'-phosphopantetheinyl transferase superfamily protein [Bradyrhizobium erythrophlei]SHH83548.1 4'-phosphopantetheinyl transferase EntD (siderophore biosynthesis) [Bradyrhizobium erythrophlei]
MNRRIACEARAAPPSRHRLSQRVFYRSLDYTDAAFALPLNAETRSRLPQALRHATQNRQREFLAGRWCAKQALQCLGAGSTHVAMAEDRAPIWPDGVVGSITHTGDFAAAAVAWAADVAALGIDSEQIIDPAMTADIADICMVDEATLFKAAHGRSFCEFCTLVFSAKESVFKCLFPLTRKFLEFSDVRITSIDWHRKYFTWTSVGEYIGTGRLSDAGGFVHTSVEMSSLTTTAG